MDSMFRSWFDHFLYLKSEREKIEETSFLGVFEIVIEFYIDMREHVLILS